MDHKETEKPGEDLQGVGAEEEVVEGQEEEEQDDVTDEEDEVGVDVQVAEITRRALQYVREITMHACKHDI